MAVERVAITISGAKELASLRDEAGSAGGAGNLSRGKRMRFHILRLASVPRGASFNSIANFLRKRMKIQRDFAIQGIETQVVKGLLRRRLTIR